MSFFQRIGNNLTGGILLGDWASMFIFYVMGAIVTMYLDFKKRDKKSKNTPVNASWTFWWKDNRDRLLIMPLMAFLLMRFISDWFPGLSQNMFWATAIGLMGDFIFIIYRELRWNLKEKFSKKLEEMK